MLVSLATVHSLGYSNISATAAFNMNVSSLWKAPDQIRVVCLPSNVHIFFNHMPGSISCPTPGPRLHYAETRSQLFFLIRMLGGVVSDLARVRSGVDADHYGRQSQDFFFNNTRPRSSTFQTVLTSSQA